jgi:anti-sigma factor RsiW
MSSNDKKLSGDEITAFHDGELAPTRAREIADRAAASPEAQVQLAALGEIGNLVRDHYGRAAQESSAGIASAWSRLEAQLEPLPSTRPGFFARFVDSLRPKLGYALVGAVGVAAGALLVSKVSGKNTIQMVMPQPVVLGERATGVELATAPMDTEVDEVDTAGGSAMIYQVPSDQADKPATTVIWVADADDAPEGPI